MHPDIYVWHDMKKCLPVLTDLNSREFSFFRATVWLSTAPTETLTHRYQVRCLLRSPLFIKAREVLLERVLLRSNKRFDLNSVKKFVSFTYCSTFSGKATTLISKRWWKRLVVKQRTLWIWRIRYSATLNKLPQFPQVPCKFQLSLYNQGWLNL